jgi:hypothetical protein
MNIDRSILIEAVAQLIKSGEIVINSDVAVMTKTSRVTPRVQTHAAVQDGGLTSSVKRTWTSQILDCPKSGSRFIATPPKVSDELHVKRIRGLQSSINKTHGVRIAVYKADGGVLIERKAA